MCSGKTALYLNLIFYKIDSKKNLCNIFFQNVILHFSNAQKNRNSDLGNNISAIFYR